MAKKVLVVLAHEEKKSLNTTLKNWIVEVLEGLGHEVKVTDLYAQNFDPVIRRRDLKDITDKDQHINYSNAAGQSYLKKTLAPFMMDEIAKVSWADLLIFQFPLYWYSMPAILKGWFEKTLVDKFAFDFSCNAMLENGYLKGKRAFLSITTGCGETFFSPNALAGDLNVYLWPMQYTLRMCGVESVKPFAVHDALYMDEKKLKDIKEKLKERLTGIMEEKPMKFVPLQSYSLPTGRLNDEFVAQVHNKAPTVGQHMGKPILYK